MPHVQLHLRPPGPTHILYGVGECSIGPVLVGRSALGICAILLGEKGIESDMAVQLSFAFPQALLHESAGALKADVQAVCDLIDQDLSALPRSAPARSIRLDVGGTDFQQRVWQTLVDIPAGQTLSYTQLAQQIQQAGAVRAVASACAANVLAVAIPCHRVLRSNGTVSGYRWGPERKRWMLQQEAQALKTKQAMA